MRTPGYTGTSLAFTEGVFNGPFYGTFAEVSTNASTGAIAGVPTDVAGPPNSGGSLVVLLLTGAQVGGVNYTLPTVASIVAAQPPGFAQQDIGNWWYKLRIVNAGSGQIITVVTNTGWTLTTTAGGVFTIANNTTRDFIVQFNGLTAATLTSIGTGTYS